MEMSSPVEVPSPTGETTQRERFRPGPIGDRKRFGKFAALTRRPEFGALAGTITVYVFFVIVAGHDFTTATATATWVNTSAELGIVAIPVALLLISGEFDLSVGSVIGASSMIVALGVSHYELPIGIAILLALGFGSLVGLVNGLVQSTTGLPSFVVTLATNFGVLGVALGASTAIGGSTAATFYPSPAAVDVFASKIGQFNISILWWLVVVAIAGWVMAKTRFGNWILATGGDNESATAAGVPVKRVKTTLFVATGLSAALLGVIQSIIYVTGDATRGQDFVFDSIIAATIGGVLLGGGYGSAVGVVFGVATYGIVNGGVFYTGWPTVWVQAFLGGLLLLAVLANNTFRKLALAARKEEDK